jgi:hypothetical protein
MSKWSARTGGGLVACLAAVALAASAGAETLAQVVAVSGQAVVERPGEAPRSLACDDVVREGESVATSPSSGAGLLVRDVYLQLDGDSRLHLATEEGAVALGLAAGGVRAVDTRPSGAAPWWLATASAEVRGSAGADFEIWLRGDEARLCVHAGSATVARTSGIPVGVPAGGCAWIAAAAVTLLDGASPAITVADSRICRYEVAALAELFTPTDVAAPPLTPGFPSVGAASAFQRDPCDNPGSGCAGDPTPVTVPPSAPPPSPPPGPPIFVDPDPDTGCGGPGFPCPPNGVF